jgi:hypothetical protein
MRIVVRGAGAVVALVVTLVVSGCASSSPQPSPTPSPSVTPLFQSDDEALAAAEEAYAAYQQIEDQVFAEGGRNGERIRTVAQGDALEAALTGFSNFQSEGYRSVGNTKFDSIRLQQYSPRASLSGEIVTVYLCLDFSGTDVLDANDQSVVAIDRPRRQPYQAGFGLSESGSLVLASRLPWGGNQVCD